jgi:hypothetical protein
MMRIRTCIFLLFLMTAPLLAQTGAVLEVNSDPPGTTISLDGEFKLAGVTPTVFSQPLVGKYELKATRDGYETYKTNLYLTGGTPLKVDIKLAPKTRFKAFLRSMVMPGWGQFYADDKTRGVLFSVTTLASGVATIIAEVDFRDKRDAYDEVMARFNEERSLERKKAMEQEVNDARQKAYDAETFRNVSLGVLIGVYTYNVLDAMIFFPNKKYDSYVPRVSIDTDDSFSKVGLTLKFSF